MGSKTAAVVDPWGRICILGEPAWRHITSARPDMALIGGVFSPPFAPDHLEADPVAGRWRYFAAGLGRSRWLRVVVDCSGRDGIIVTAFPRAEDLADD